MATQTQTTTMMMQQKQQQLSITATEIKRRKKERERELSSSSEEYYSAYFEDYDADGDSYNLAWRYLGVYIDNTDDEDDDDGNSGTRKVLWAAYYDPNYSGHQIGEYAYYDWATNVWDNSTCVSGSTCARMDCHGDTITETNTLTTSTSTSTSTSTTTTSTWTASTNWTLVGVYKESLEFDNDSFFEQLFKHQGVCLWTGTGDTSDSNYQFMQTMRENDMVTYGSSCYQIESGVYIGAKPVVGGDLTLAVYSDTYCLTELSSDSYSVDDYVSSSTGTSWYSSTGKSWSSAFTTWNYMMEAYKVCQPCRAYSKTYNIQEDDRNRDLVEYNDGEGEEEMNGYNCYDDAHYRNCNQCFKFETHTDMEEASEDDLALATTQGTILRIDVEDVEYGGAPYTAVAETDTKTYDDEDGSSSYADVAYSSMGAVGVAVVVVTGLLAKYRMNKKQRRPRMILTEEGDADQPLE